MQVEERSDQDQGFVSCRKKCSWSGVYKLKEEVIRVCKLKKEVIKVSGIQVEDRSDQGLGYASRKKKRPDTYVSRSGVSLWEKELSRSNEWRCFYVCVEERMDI